MTKLYFKAIYGFDAEDYIPVEEDELEKAIYAHMTGSKTILKGGSMSGDKIHHVVEDNHRTMGWNRGYKLCSDDYAELREKGIDTKLQKVLGKTKERVAFLVANNRQAEIGKNVPIPELDTRRPYDVSAGVKMLADKMKA